MRSPFSSMFRPTLGFGSRAAPRCAFNAIVAMVVLVGIVCARGGVLTNCSEADLRVLLDQGGLVTVQCDGTINLTDALSVTRDTVLDATGHQFILDGRSSVRVLYVRTNVNFTSVNVTIADGSATNGAGLYNDGGFVVLRKCVFRANSARGIVFDIEPGNIEGGAILNLGTVTATGCAFLQNSATGGGPPPPLATTGSGLGAGGAIANRGVLSADYCTFLANSAAGGPGTTSWYLKDAGPGGWAQGGAIYSVGTLRIDQSLFASNSVVGGPGGAAEAWSPVNGGLGGFAYGGALFSSGTSALVNCTLAWNKALGGDGGRGGSGSGVPGGSGGVGGFAYGGAFYEDFGTLEVTNCTIAYNSSIYGTGGSAGNGTPPGQRGSNGTAYGAVAGLGPLAINSILSENSPANAERPLIDAGHNLSSDSSCALNGQGSRNNVATLLGPLSNHGGATVTIALLAGSPAIDAADNRCSPRVDQRGFPRPVGPAADIGAYEYESVLLTSVLAAPDRFDVIILGDPGQTCELLSSSDLLRWAPIATNQFGLDGTLVFHDDPTGVLQKFFRVVLP